MMLLETLIILPLNNIQVANRVFGTALAQRPF